MTRKTLVSCAAVWVGATVLRAAQICSEAAVPVQLRDGQEFSTPLSEAVVQTRAGETTEAAIELKSVKVPAARD
jgi:hypothetical protein